MRTPGFLALTALLLGSLAATAGASSQKQITLPLHGTIQLAGSHVLCGSGQASGSTYIDCGIANAKGQPKPGGYLALMLGNGKVNVLAVTTKKTVFSRAPASRETGTASYPTVQPGDEITLPGAPSLFCQTSLTNGTNTIVCYFHDAKGKVRVGSYSFGMSDKFATTISWDAKLKGHLVKAWPENG